MNNISIFIQTLNEESNLPELLETVSWSDDVVVLDSISTDRTKEIALAHGCRWYQRVYDGRANNQNWAMANIEFKNEWVFYLDADERMTNSLREEIHSISLGQDKNVAYYCGRRNYFFDKWLRHSMPPGFIMRFFKPKYIRFERDANPVPIVDGGVGYLTQMFDHYNFSKGLSEWQNRHVKYSTYEAKEAYKAFHENPIKLVKLFSFDPATRRKELKNISFRLPFRGVLRFIYTYLVQRGFLDGYHGYVYARLIARYEADIGLKLKLYRRGYDI